MGSEFKVQPVAIDQQAGVIAKRRGPCSSVADAWQGAARGVVTGDPGVDQQTAAVGAAAERLSRVIGQVMEALAARMTTAADNYRACDVQTGTAYKSLEPLLGRVPGRAPGATPATGPDGPPSS